jgi:hypothetical protein
MLDFLLGWFGVDLYGDDLEGRKLKDVSRIEKKSEG